MPMDHTSATSAAISCSSSGNNTIIAAVTGYKIIVHAYTLVVTTAVTCRWYDGAGGTALSGAMPFGANGGVSTPFNTVGHFTTTAGTALVLSLGSGVQVSGHITYSLIPG